MPDCGSLAQGFLLLAGLIGVGFVALSVVEWRRALRFKAHSLEILREARRHLRDIQRQAGLPLTPEEDGDGDD